MQRPPSSFDTTTAEINDFHVTTREHDNEPVSRYHPRTSRHPLHHVGIGYFVTRKFLCRYPFKLGLVQFN